MIEKSIAPVAAVDDVTNTSDEWTAGELRSLRCRLGWSQADMARHLKTELCTVVAWESGQQPPHVEQSGRLRLIYQQAEVNADRIQRRPLAEVMMRNLKLSQVHNFDVMNKLDSDSTAGSITKSLDDPDSVPNNKR